VDDKPAEEIQVGDEPAESTQVEDNSTDSTHVKNESVERSKVNSKPAEVSPGKEPSQTFRDDGNFGLDFGQFLEDQDVKLNLKLGYGNLHIWKLMTF